MDPGADDWHPAIPDRIPTAPDLAVNYDDFEDMELIGTGGDAEVYRATVVRDGEEHAVAVKQPRLEGTVHSDVLERFDREADTWAKLDDHPGVVGVIDWATEPLPWIALEYMDGGPLGDRSLPLGLAEGLWVGVSICRAVRHAHRRGVAHLDLKPANVLFRQTDSEHWDAPKVSDWGLAKLLLEHSKSVEGLSPTYASPEQFDPDEFGSPDDFTDIYQVCAMLYAVFTGEPPFTGPTPAVMRSVLDDEPGPPSDRNPDLPPDLDGVLLQGLSKEKSDRQETITHLREDLERVIETHVADDGASAARGVVAGGIGPGSTTATDDGSAPETGGEAPGDGDPTPSPGGAGGSGPPPTDPSDGSGSALDRRTLLKVGGAGVVLAAGAVGARELVTSNPTGSGANAGGDGGGTDGNGGPGATTTDTTRTPAATDTTTETVETTETTSETTETTSETTETTTETTETTTTEGYDGIPSGSRTIRLGILMGVSGGLRNVGPPIRNAARLAVTYLDGQDSPFQVDSRFEDTRTDTSVAGEAAAELVDAGYPMICGALSSQITTHVANSVTIPGRVTLCSPASTSPTITTLEDDDYVWRTPPTDALQGEVMARVARDRLGAASTSVLHQSNQYGNQLAESYVEAFRQAGGRVLVEQAFDPNQDSYAAELERVMADRPDVLTVVGYPDSGAQIFRDFYGDFGGYGVDILVPDGLKVAELPDDVGNPMDNVVGTAPLAAGPGKDLFRRLYREEYGSDPGIFTAHAFDAAALLCLANAAAGSNDGPAVRNEMARVANPGGTRITPENLGEGLVLAANGEDVDYRGASSACDFDANGDMEAVTYEVFAYGSQGLHRIDTITSES